MANYQLTDPFLSPISTQLTSSSNWDPSKLGTDFKLPSFRNQSIQSAQKKWNKENSWLSKNKSSVYDVGNALGSLKNLIPNKTDNATTNTINSGVDALSNTLGSIPTPYTQAASAAIKGMSFVGRGVNQLIGMETPKTGIDKALSSDIAMSTGIGALNALTKTKVKGTDSDLLSAANQYGNAESVEGGEVGGISKAWSWLTGGKNKAKQLKAKVNRANISNLQKADIVNQSNLNKNAANVQGTYLKNQNQLSNSFNTNILAANKGTKLELLKLKNQVKKHQKGGILEGVNLIPSGALHKNLNHLTDKLPEEVEITKKGIPVIQAEEGGKLQSQVAEVEREELTLHLELTKKLENLKKEYESGNENALLEAGKLLTDEILYNTNDNTNLLNQLS